MKYADSTTAVVRLSKCLQSFFFFVADSNIAVNVISESSRNTPKVNAGNKQEVRYNLWKTRNPRILLGRYL